MLEGPAPEELRCVIAVIRHGDRTPKQKMKMKVTSERILSFLQASGASARKEVKLKRHGCAMVGGDCYALLTCVVKLPSHHFASSALQLQRLLDTTRSLLAQVWRDDYTNCSSSAFLPLPAPEPLLFMHHRHPTVTTATARTPSTSCAR